MAIPTASQLNDDILNIMQDGNGYRSSNLVEPISKLHHLTELEKGDKTASGAKRLNLRITHSLQYLQRAKLIDKNGHEPYKINQHGRDYLNTKHSSMHGKSSTKNDHSRSSIQTTADNTSIKSSNVNEEAVKEDLLRAIRKMSGTEFEKITEKMFEKMGYIAEHSGGSGDKGIDLILRDKLKLTKIIVSCKKRSGSVISQNIIREFKGTLSDYSDSKGILITTSDFTGPIKNEPTEDYKLIDGKEVVDLLVKYNVGIKDEIVQRKIIDQEFFKNL